ncbi:MAG: carboxypeptidase regulatory-like domain-containing protein [Bryobacterales bacterium]|nr:carboxypeptidase regulatory-like domain-containing protein [Bryobacterales bacterium]
MLPGRAGLGAMFCLIACTFLAFPPGASQGAEKQRKETAGDPVSVVAGTVFREPGFALAGAQVTITPDPDASSPRKPKLKKMKALSDSRGEFAFRVPSIAMKYVVSAVAEGFTPQRKPVVIHGGERAEVYFTLQPVSR